VRSIPAIIAVLGKGDSGPAAHLVLWLKATLPVLGGVGVFCSSFIDSSFVPLPLVTDLLVIELSSLHPLRMPVYVTMAALGSLGGCILIYWPARKGGEAFYLKTHGHAPEKIQRFIEKHPVACVLLPAAAPFPVPFKPFVIAQGAFQVPFVTFLLGTLAGRFVRFFMEGYLGVEYGEAAKELVLHQKWHSIAVVLGLVLVCLLVRRLPFFRKWKTSHTD
jgi:membrane protein YqaA with SNARE-associated domain